MIIRVPPCRRKMACRIGRAKSTRGGRTFRYNETDLRGLTMHAWPFGFRRYTFPDLKTLLAKATPLRSGDKPDGLAAETGEERVAAQFTLADLPPTIFLNEPVIP